MTKRTVQDGSKALEKALKELHGRNATQEEVTEPRRYKQAIQKEHERAQQKVELREGKTELREELVDEFIMGRKKPLPGDRQRERALLQVQCAVHKQTWMEAVKETLGKAKSRQPIREVLRGLLIFLNVS